MTADERIEKLLNSFGQTISDLPKAETSMYAYSREHLGSANLAAWRWHGNQSLCANLDCEDYICHLADVIDRMEVALATAKRWMPCNMCEHLGLSCDEHSDECTFWIRDKKLRDVDIGGFWNAYYE